jgi:hypothetical protein
MIETFKKSEPVTFIASWDDKGTFYYRHAVVYSCGKKEMILTDAATGEEMGRRFRPVVGINEDGFAGCVRRLTDAEAEAACLKLAARFVADRRALYTELADSTKHGRGYADAMKRNLAELHEPQAIKR